MRDRAGFFAGCADTLTAMCVYYLVAGVLIMGRRGWGLHLFWLLLCAAICSFFFAWLLKKPRSAPLLTAVTGVLFALVMALFLFVSTIPLGFGYVFLLAVGDGMAVGLPLYYCLNRPQVMRHLTHLDVLIIALLGILLVREALSVDGATVALMVIVLFLDAAGAVGLRMSDGETPDGGSALKASMVALAGAAGLALVISLFTALFSRSGAVTGGALRGIGAFLAAIGRGIERFSGGCPGCSITGRALRRSSWKGSCLPWPARSLPGRAWSFPSIPRRSASSCACWRSPQRCWWRSC